MKKIFTICAAMFLGTTAFSQAVGIIGSAAAPYDWSVDIPMNTTDDENYDLTLDLVVGEVKFRQDQAWTINWGAVDFPTGTGVQDGSNIPVATAGNYTVTFVKSTGVYNFTMNSAAGINENSADLNLTVYPNPANESTNFQFATANEATITLFDLAGKVVASKVETGKVITVNTADLNAGIYMYSVKVGNNVTTGKITKK
jgi:hypothetical protein